MPGTRRSLLLTYGSLVGIGALVVAGCASRPYGQISDSWTISAGTKGGAFEHQPRPTAGAPLAGNPGAKSCLSDADALATLGPTCDHETENAPPAAPVGDLAGGIPEPSKEVRWYCADRMVVRIVLERCDASGAGNLDGIKPLEISVSPHAQAD